MRETAPLGAALTASVEEATPEEEEEEEEEEEGEDEEEGTALLHACSQLSTHLSPVTCFPSVYHR